MDWDNEFDDVSPMEDDAYEQNEYEDEDDGAPLIIGWLNYDWLNYDNLSGSDDFSDNESLEDDNEDDIEEWDRWSDE